MRFRLSVLALGVAALAPAILTAQQQPTFGCRTSVSCRPGPLSNSGLNDASANGTLVGGAVRFGPGFQFSPVLPLVGALRKEKAPAMTVGIFRLVDVSLLPPSPPPVLQIYREAIKPGNEAAYAEIETDTARMCARLGCPHPYLAIESLTGPKEVWFFNAYDSPADQKRVAEDYAKNAALVASLRGNSERKARLTGDHREVLASYRADASRGIPWRPGQGRFLVIAIAREIPRLEATVFEAPGGELYVVTEVKTRAEAEAAVAVAGPGARVFAIRPAWSLPAREWIASDPEFWRARHP